jgi:hypothetical protein
VPTTDPSRGSRRIPLPLGCVTLTLPLSLAALLCVASGFALSGCGGSRGTVSRRIVEREESVGKVHLRLKSELSPARGTLGDPIAWRLTATLGEGARAGAAVLETPPASLELDASRAPTQAKAGAGLQWSREYVLRGFDIGTIPLPRAALPVTTSGRTDTLEFPRDTLFVDSLTPAATGMLRPDRGPITPPLRPVDVAVMAGAALLLAALIALLLRLWLEGRRRKAVSLAPAPSEPPEAILSRALDALERDVAALPRDVFYEQLAQALRRYASAATGVPAADLTTTELDRELSRRPGVSAEGQEALIAALRRADLAKFARFRDEESEARSIVRQARSVPGKL